MQLKFNNIVNYIESNEINIYGISVSNKENYLQKVYIDEQVNIFSIGKSITALCIYILCDRNKINVNDKLISFFDKFNYSEGTENITIQNLLDMQSTKDCSYIGAFPEDEEDYLGRFFEYECTLSSGTFRYSNFCSYALGRIVSKISGLTVLQFAYENIFEPLDIKMPRWATDNKGYTVCANNLFLDIDELSKIGILMRDRGLYNGKQIIGKENFDKFESEFTLKEEELIYKNSFWNLDIDDAYFMKGIYSNVVIVIPKQNISITITAKEKDNEKRDALLNFIKGEFCK